MAAERIFLIGYMFCGKTTVGKQLAHRLGYAFVDTDQLFEQRYHTTIPLFFQHYGEEAFRRLEQQVLHDTVSGDWLAGGGKGLVVATGGGTPCYGDNMDWINAHGTSVYLRMSAEALNARASKSKKKRPLLASLDDSERCSFIARQLEERDTYYCRAHVVVDAFSIDMETLLKKL